MNRPENNLRVDLINGRPVISTTLLCKALGFNVSKKYLNEIGVVEALSTAQGHYWWRDEINNVFYAISNDMFSKSKIHPSEWDYK